MTRYLIYRIESSCSSSSNTSSAGADHGLAARSLHVGILFLEDIALQAQSQLEARRQIDSRRRLSFWLGNISSVALNAIVVGVGNEIECEGLGASPDTSRPGAPAAMGRQGPGDGAVLVATAKGNRGRLPDEGARGEK